MKKQEKCPKINMNVTNKSKKEVFKSYFANLCNKDRNSLNEYQKDEFDKLITQIFNLNEKLLNIRIKRAINFIDFPKEEEFKEIKKKENKSEIEKEWLNIMIDRIKTEPIELNNLINETIKTEEEIKIKMLQIKQLLSQKD